MRKKGNPHFCREKTPSSDKNHKKLPLILCRTRSPPAEHARQISCLANILAPNYFVLIMDSLDFSIGPAASAAAEGGDPLHSAYKVIGRRE